MVLQRQIFILIIIYFNSLIIYFHFYRWTITLVVFLIFNNFCHVFDGWPATLIILTLRDNRLTINIRAHHFHRIKQVLIIQHIKSQINLLAISISLAIRFYVLDLKLHRHTKAFTTLRSFYPLFLKLLYRLIKWIRNTNAAHPIDDNRTHLPIVPFVKDTTFKHECTDVC